MIEVYLLFHVFVKFLGYRTCLGFEQVLGIGCPFCIFHICYEEFVLSRNKFRRGSLLSAAIFVYAACAPINGYAGGSMYARFGGKQWIKQLLLGVSFLLFFLFSLYFYTIFVKLNEQTHSIGI